MIRVHNVVGARPNFMKIAPLVHEMRRYPDMHQLLVHTGQHYDDNLSDVFFDELDIPRPDINLGIGSGTRDAQIKKIDRAFEPVLVKERPDLVVVVGDVNSTIACARVAGRYGVKVAHVEAGLRSFDDAMPEEHNRRETDAVADYLFVTEESGLRNLQTEQVPGKAYMVGNVMIDTLVRNLERAARSDVITRLSLEEGHYVVGTFHRPSNVDERGKLEHLLETIRAVCRRSRLVLPLHPRTRRSLERNGLLSSARQIENLILTEPLGYLDFLNLVKHAGAVITDSGGIQEETTYLGIPCLTMRENTERPVTVDMGTNALVGADRDRLLAELDTIVAGRFKKGQVPPLWDGKSARRIVAIIARELGTAAGQAPSVGPTGVADPRT